MMPRAGALRGAGGPKGLKVGLRGRLRRYGARGGEHWETAPGGQAGAEGDG